MNLDSYEILISVDIGYSGGIAFFDTVSRSLLSLHAMPVMDSKSSSGKVKKIIDTTKLLHLLEIPFIHNDNAIVVYENVHAFPFQGAVSVGSLMEQKGIIRGMSIGLGYDEMPIQPKTWQKYYGMTPPVDLKGKSKTQTITLRKKWLKEKSLALARANFPDWVGKLESPTAHGLSDATLIGLYTLETSPL